MNQIPNRLPNAASLSAVPASGLNKPGDHPSPLGRTDADGVPNGPPFQDIIANAGNARATMQAPALQLVSDQTVRTGPRLPSALETPMPPETAVTRQIDTRSASAPPEDWDHEVEAAPDILGSSLPNLSGDELRPPADETVVNDILPVAQPGSDSLDGVDLSARLPNEEGPIAVTPSEEPHLPLATDDRVGDADAHVLAVTETVIQPLRSPFGQDSTVSNRLTPVIGGRDQTDALKTRPGQRAGPFPVEPPPSTAEKVASAVNRADADAAPATPRPANGDRAATFAGPTNVSVTVLQVETHMQAPGQQPIRTFEVESGLTRPASVASTVSASTNPQVHELAPGPEPLKVLKLQLQPGHLGSVTVQISRQGNEFRIAIQPQHAQTAGLLRSDASALNAVLQSAAPLPETFTVQVLDQPSGTQGGFGASTDGSRAGASTHHDQQTSQAFGRTDDQADDGRTAHGEHDEQGEADRGRRRGELYL